MVRFCYLRLHLGVEIVSCRLLQWTAKITKQIIMVRVPQ